MANQKVYVVIEELRGTIADVRVYLQYPKNLITPYNDELDEGERCFEVEVIDLIGGEQAILDHWGWNQKVYYVDAYSDIKGEKK